MPAWITRLGHALPGDPIPQDALAAWLEPRLHPAADRARLALFARKAGVAARHSVLDLLGGEGDRIYPVGAPHADAGARSRLFAERAPALAEQAVRNALGKRLAGITHLVAATCTGAVAPGLDLLLIERLGLDPGVRRTVVGFMGCYAALPALRLARDTVRANPAARVLVVCCELGSLHLQPGPADDDLLAACLFGDGAAAALVEGAPSGCALRLDDDACAVVPETGDRMAWTAAASGFALRLAPGLDRSLGPASVRLVGRLLGGAPAAASRWVIHPGGPRIIEQVGAALGLAEDALLPSRAALAAAGNRSSATVLAILADLARDAWSGACVALAFGPGLTAEGILLHRE